jgi:hypothetical protein
VTSPSADTLPSRPSGARPGLLVLVYLLAFVVMADARAISLFAFSLFLGSGTGTAAPGGLIETEGYDALLAVCGVGLLALGLAAPRSTELRRTESGPPAPTPSSG